MIKYVTIELRVYPIADKEMIIVSDEKENCHTLLRTSFNLNVIQY